MEERNSRYELQTSRNGLSVPVINGVFLHSIYNPIKEANTFALGHKSNLIANNKALVLGLGFGYHIEEIAKILNQHHKNYQIVIIEPNEQLVFDFNAKRRFEDQRISIISGEISEIFSMKSVVEFLKNRPSIIRHESSFALEKEYYTNFLSYKAPTHFDSMRGVLTDTTMSMFDTTRDESIDQQVNRIISSGTIVNRQDYLMMAFNEVIASDNQGMK